MLSCTQLCYVVPSYVKLYPAMLCCTLLCLVVSSYVKLYQAMLSCTQLCYVVPSYDMFYSTKWFLSWQWRSWSDCIDEQVDLNFTVRICPKICFQIFFFFFFFFFYLGFTALSRIFHLYLADRSSKVGENRSTRRKTTWPSVSRTWLSHIWPELGSNHSGEKPNGLRVNSLIH